MEKKINKQVPGVGEVEFTGHFFHSSLNNITWHELDYTTEQNGKIASVCDDINPEEFDEGTHKKSLALTRP